VPSLKVTMMSRPSKSLQLPSYSAQALGKIGEIDFLVRVLQGKESPGGQYLGAQGLAAAGTNATQAVSALNDALNSSDDVMQMYAAEALGKIGTAASESIPRLASLSQHGPNFVRHAAGTALVNIRTPEARDAVRPYLQRERRIRSFFDGMGVFALHPWLAAVVGAAFGAWAWAGWRVHPERRAFQRFLLFPAFSWCAYSLWEYEAQRQRANIRIDLLLIYPFLAGLTVIAIGVWCAGLLIPSRRLR
jgi:hypothetical protein